MPNEENLKKFGSGARSESEEREMQSKGGRNSGITRRRKRTMRDTAKMLLDMEVPKQAKELKAKLKAMGVDDEDLTYQTAVIVGIINQAMKGNTKAASFLRDTIGENPVLEQRKEEFEYKKELDAGANIEYESLEEIEGEIYGCEDGDEKEE